MEVNSTFIRKKINENNEIIAKNFKPEVFVLDTNIVRLIRENKQLQKECRHDFVDGVCIYCDLEDKSQ